MRVHFRKVGWIFFPVSIIGWVIAIVYAAVSIFTLVSIDRNYNSLTNSLIRFFPYFISFSVVFYWIAANTSGKNSG
jgi:hypothetical protein